MGGSGYLVTPVGEWRQIVFSFQAVGEVTRLTLGYFGGPGRTITARVDDVTVWPALEQNRPPQLSAEVTVDGDGTLRYTADAEDLDGAVVGVNWDFGDGGRSEELSGAYAAASAGAYTAIVRVADDQGAVTTRAVPWSWAGDGPTLAVDSPADGATVDEARVTLRGTAGDDVATIAVSRDDLVSAAAILDADGGWTATLDLAPGDNRLLIQAVAADGDMAAQTMAVRYVPAGELAVTELAGPDSVAQWAVAEITFQVTNSAASDPQLPYDLDLPAGLDGCDGISVDVLFSPDDWRTVYTRPAYWGWRYTRTKAGGEEWLYPRGRPGLDGAFLATGGRRLALSRDGA